jgi:hypothetical protein
VHAYPPYMRYVPHAAFLLGCLTGCSQGSEPTQSTDPSNSTAPSTSSPTAVPTTPGSVSPEPSVAPTSSSPATPTSTNIPSTPTGTSDPTTSTSPSPSSSTTTTTEPPDETSGLDTSSEPPAESSCTNGKRDGREAGIDCGGDCPTACVAYERNKPNPNNDNRSGCEANGNGFMCPRAMVFSPEMVQAAFDDWGGNEAPFVYGVVGHDPDPGGVDGQSASYSSTCCQCYQLVFKGPRDPGVEIPLPKPMIVQAFNTYAGGPTAFDVYMGVGGHGNFNGCTQNGTLYSSYPDTGGDWVGGVRATRYSQCSRENAYTSASIGSDTCQDFVESECSKIQTSDAYLATARKSCMETNHVETHYHMNWDVVVKRVECPVGLTRVTGCQLNGQGLPEADPTIQTASQALQNGFRDGYHTTTMEDCCRPTCAWPSNVQNTKDGWSRFYTCDRNGSID